MKNGVLKLDFVVQYCKLCCGRQASRTRFVIAHDHGKVTCRRDPHYDTKPNYR